MDKCYFWAVSNQLSYMLSILFSFFSRNLMPCSCVDWHRERHREAIYRKFGGSGTGNLQLQSNCDDNLKASWCYRL